MEMNELSSAFDNLFRALTGNEPFPWQSELYRRFLEGDFPSSCNLPTGLGKTAVIPIWLLALAHAPIGTVPRRLVYVVNRRAVVDQATREAERLREKLATPSSTDLSGLVARLREFESLASADSPNPPLAISTLRGQFADNREWSADPCRPAVIVGTVDMIGSRLLFSGYGVGFKGKPLHAAFLGQDSLVIHDEAHLEPAFQDLLIAIETEQRQGEQTEELPWPKMRVMELSATGRGDGQAFSLTVADRRNALVRQRIGAKKKIYLHENDDPKRLADEIAEIALKHRDSGRAVLIFLRRVEDVEKTVTRLRKEKQHTRQLTGTIRGFERDQLFKDPVFLRFLPPSDRPPHIEPLPGTVFLVSSSAGETGLNASADHLVCDLSTFESMAQRFGRVNRFGERDDTRIDVVHPTSFDRQNKVDLRLGNTLDLLQRLDGDGSPNALGNLDVASRLAAFAPPPQILPVSDILLDAWALTTIRGTLPGRPPVEPYLHGISEWEPPETHVAWRLEVEMITDELLDAYPPKDLLDDYPLKPHELLRDNNARIFDRLKKLKAAENTPVWIVSDDGSVVVTMLGKLISAGKDDLSSKTVLLPPSAGGLEVGMLTSDSAAADDVSGDLIDELGRSRRARVWEGENPPDGMRLVRTIDFKSNSDDYESEETPGRRLWYWYELPNAGDSDGSKTSNKSVEWKVHTKDVVENSLTLVKRLPLPDGMKHAIVLAARFHDLGKLRGLFQKILGNFDLQTPLAKSGKRGGCLPEKYRHEFGSLLDVQHQDEFKALAGKPELQELILHLIAVHHGRGRPHFPSEEAFDPESKEVDVRNMASEVPRRFAKLQRRYGRWGLAYLESLLRAADYAASASPSEFLEEKK
jgi:CRISPR-associated endonuclease/helicase Cas3